MNVAGRRGWMGALDGGGGGERAAAKTEPVGIPPVRARE